MSPLRLAHRVFSNLGLYEGARYSATYDKLLRFIHPQYYHSLKADLIFFRDLLREPQRLIFDVGANNGDKAWVFKQLSERVVCCEPDAFSISRLRRRFYHSRNVIVEPCAVGREKGMANLFISHPGSAYNTLNEEWREPAASKEKRTIAEVPMTTLDELIKKYGCPDYAKLDIEGFEWQAIQGLHQPIPCISIEANLPQFYEETILALSWLLRLSPGAVFNLRSGDSLVFGQPVDLAVTTEFLKRADCITYDVFVFSH